MGMKRLAVLGHPVSHSRSPAMQTAALEALGLAAEWSYEAIDMLPAEFERLARALPEQGFAGANVTIPHKQAALALAGEASAAAREIGAANTLTFAGEIRADNTDAHGLLAALPRSPSGKRALVLGAGGSARAAAWGLANEGGAVEVWNRTAERAELLASEIAARAGAGSVTAVDAERAREGAHELIVNATAVGMPGSGGAPFEQLPVDPAGLGEGVILVDLVYGHLDTELVRVARERGAEVVDGLEVLVQQGAESLRIWTGAEPPLDVMRKAAAA
ncbi:MAG: shikimate dehydrogenase [Actinomycetota bacterium]|nr:shikimate dehydrogenase [Actinomycetota bacterium]